MRKFALATLIALIMLVPSAEADASLKGKVRKLQGQVTTLQGQVGALSTQLGCFRSTPMTQYNGYDYNFDSFLTTAIDLTEVGDAVSFYLLRDTCGTTPVVRPQPDALRRH